MALAFMELSNDAMAMGPAHGASPLQIVVMMYDGALASMRAARIAAAKGDTAAQTQFLTKAEVIVASLIGCLEDEGEMAETLGQLYAFVLNELSAAGVRNDMTRVQRCERVMSDLRETWLALEACTQPMQRAA